MYKNIPPKVSEFAIETCRGNIRIIEYHKLDFESGGYIHTCKVFWDKSEYSIIMAGRLDSACSCLDIYTAHVHLMTIFSGCYTSDRCQRISQCSEVSEVRKWTILSSALI